MKQTEGKLMCPSKVDEGGSGGMRWGWRGRHRLDQVDLGKPGKEVSILCIMEAFGRF